MPEYHNLDFASLQVRDLEVSAVFYQNVLGFERVDEERPNAVVFKNDAGAIFAIRTPLMPLPIEGALGNGVSLWFDTSDVDAICSRVEASAGRVLAEPAPGPFGRQIMVTDPDGYVLVFHAYTEQNAQ